MAKKHLIIGAGPAALAALEKIRSLSQDDEIKVVTAEDCLPYSPTALPYLLSAKMREPDLWLRDESYFEKLNVRFAKNCEVIRVVPEERRVIYRDGGSDECDDLLIATGAGPQVPAGDGTGGNDVLAFHTLTDYHSLLKRIKTKREITILGAGMVALEVAMALADLGHPIKIITRGAPLRAYFDRQVQEYIIDLFDSRGLQVIMGKTVKGVECRADKVHVLCNDGETFGADFVVSCLGVVPRVAFLAGTGVEVAQGIRVNDRMQTNIETIYAAGDCAEAPDFFRHRPGVNAIVPTAVTQGKVAGANMAGTETHYPGWISMNILNFFGSVACSIGIVMPQEEDFEVMEEKNDRDRAFKRLVFRNGRLQGAMFLNTAVNPGVISYLIENKVEIGRHAPLLLEKVQETSLWLMLEAERRLSRVAEG